jgi:hypothetical protein
MVVRRVHRGSGSVRFGWVGSFVGLCGAHCLPCTPLCASVFDLIFCSAPHGQYDNVTLGITLVLSGVLWAYERVCCFDPFRVQIQRFCARARSWVLLGTFGACSKVCSGMPARCMRALNDALAPLSLSGICLTQGKEIKWRIQRENATKGAKTFYSGLLSTKQRAAYNNMFGL